MGTKYWKQQLEGYDKSQPPLQRVLEDVIVKGLIPLFERVEKLEEEAERHEHPALHCPPSSTFVCKTE